MNDDINRFRCYKNACKNDAKKFFKAYVWLSFGWKFFSLIYGLAFVAIAFHGEFYLVNGIFFILTLLAVFQARQTYKQAFLSRQEWLDRAHKWDKLEKRAKESGL